MKDWYKDDITHAIVRVMLDPCNIRDWPQAHVVDTVYTPELSRCEGGARRVMEQLIADADTEGVCLYLIVLSSPDDDNCVYLTDSGLVRFYGSLGFEVEPERLFGSQVMVRQPR